jgi:hypothetical protein
MSSKSSSCALDARTAFAAALAAADPTEAVNRAVHIRDDYLHISTTPPATPSSSPPTTTTPKPLRFHLLSYKRIVVVGAGKACVPMAEAIELLFTQWLATQTTRSTTPPTLIGHIVTKYHHAANSTLRRASLSSSASSSSPPSSSSPFLSSSPSSSPPSSSPPSSWLTYSEAAHPVPDAAGVRGTERIVNLLLDACGDGDSDGDGDENNNNNNINNTPGTLVLVLLSGGGSALLCLPQPNITLADLRATNDALYVMYTHQRGRHLTLPLIRSATPCDVISCCPVYVVQRHVTSFRVAPYTLCNAM